MDGYRVQGHRTAEARTRELMRAVRDMGPLAGEYVARQDTRQWAMATARPPSAAPGTGTRIAQAARGRVGAALVSFGQRLQGERRTRPTVASALEASGPVS